MAIPLLDHHGVSNPGRGPGSTTRLFFWVRGDRQHFSSPPVFDLTVNSINTWYDQSFYDHHLFATGTQRATRVPSAITCFAQVNDSASFDGVNDREQSLVFEESFLSSSLQTEFGVHIAFKASNNTDATLFSIPYLGVPRDGISISLIPSGVVARVTLGLDCGDDGFVPTLFTIPGGLVYNDGNVHTISLVFDQNLLTDNLSLTVDGSQVSVTLETQGIFANSSIITLGDYDSSGSFFFNGQLLEVIAQWTGDNTERAVIHDYYQRKWCSL